MRVYAGVDVLTGRALYLEQVVAAGPNAWERAEAAREELVRQVRQGCQPRAPTPVCSGIWRDADRAEIERLCDADELVLLLKRKRAQLAVSGTIFEQQDGGT